MLRDLRYAVRALRRSYGVAQRVREFAVRLALGAKPGSILLLVMREGLGVTGWDCLRAWALRPRSRKP